MKPIIIFKISNYVKYLNSKQNSMACFKVHSDECIEQTVSSIGSTGTEIWPFQILSLKSEANYILPFLWPLVLPFVSNDAKGNPVFRYYSSIFSDHFKHVFSLIGLTGAEIRPVKGLSKKIWYMNCHLYRHLLNRFYGYFDPF